MSEQKAVRSFTPSVTSNRNSDGTKSIKCKLCRGTPVEPTYLTCKHAFCYICLHNYVERMRYTDSLDFPCPHCNKLSAPPWGIWHLSHKVWLLSVLPHCFTQHTIHKHWYKKHCLYFYYLKTKICIVDSRSFA